MLERCYNTHVMDGIILLNKPAGMTSFAAARRCRNIFHEKKTGHTGTLDPNASGVLIVLLGKYTKLAPYCVKNHKHYRARFKLGLATDTQDIWGTITERKTPSPHTEEEILAACASLTGDIKQLPPMYSAIKVNGQKLYDLARKGIEVERKERDAHISVLHVEHLQGDEYSMDAVVSSGTYIRTLIYDFAAKLGEYGVMTELERVGIEQLSIEDSANFEDLEEGRGLLDPAAIISSEWKLVEAGIYERYIRTGRIVTLHSDEPKVIFTKDGELLAAYVKEEDGVYHCQRGLL